MPLASMLCSCPADDDYGAWLRLFSLKPSEELLQRVGDFLLTYLQENRLSCYVMGLSGGIDSSFLAALLYYRQIPYLGLNLPIATNTPDEIGRALAVSRSYRSTFQIIPALHDLTDLYHVISSRFYTIVAQTDPVTEGNLKARLRMLLLYHVANLSRGCVLSTDQADELLTGFWTLHGDVGDVSPIQLFPKSTEYGLARILADKLSHPEPLLAAMSAIPTDGLGITRSDLDQLGVATYEALEAIFVEFFSLKEKEILKGKLEPIDQKRMTFLNQTIPIKRFLTTGYKRKGPALLKP